MASTPDMRFLPYAPELETVEPDEAETQEKLIEVFRGIIETTNADYGHAVRSVHAKSHAILDAELEVPADLPPAYAQGVFARTGTYRAIMRFSTNPGDILPDVISVPRGLAVKLLDVDGAGGTQDFVMAAGEAFVAPSPKAFLKNLKLLAATTDRVEGLKKAVSAVFRTAERGLEALGGESAMLKTMGGAPNTLPAADTMFTQAPIRFGDHVAKLQVVPASANLRALEGKEIDIAGREDALREEMNAFFVNEAGEWLIRAQLCTDVATMPIEDASVPWPQEESPYVAVGILRAAPQTAWSAERSRAGDDGLAFTPWHCLDAHRPLGAIMRARKPAYAESAGLRGRLNRCPMHEPGAAFRLD